MVASKDQYQRAIDKAEALGGARNIVSQYGPRWTVRGSVAPTVYIVTDWPDGELHCSCPAGQYDQPCWHAACVKLRLWGQEAARTTADEPLPIHRPMPEIEGPSAYDLLVGAGR